MTGITIITPTGGRPEAFALCEFWMRRQTWAGERQWIVVDDSAPETACTMRQEIVRPRPIWQPGENTQARNLLAAFPLIRNGKIVIVEDDDWYAPAYLEIMASRLDAAPLVGERNARYYNVATRQYMTCPNVKHSSLCQSAFRIEAIPKLTSICESAKKFLDIELFKMCPDQRLYENSGTCIGIKGMPGRKGIGSGHRSGAHAGWKPDPNLSMLQSWVGDDADAYRGYGERPC